jgi:hypothetical protein
LRLSGFGKPRRTQVLASERPSVDQRRGVGTGKRRSVSAAANVGTAVDGRLSGVDMDAPGVAARHAGLASSIDEQRSAQDSC